MMYNWIKRLHGWIGISAGLIMALMGITGATMAFEPQLLSLANPQTQFAHAQPVQWDPLKQWGEQYAERWSSLTIDTQSLHAVEVKVQQQGQATELLLHPITTDLVAPVRGTEFFDQVEHLHRDLLLGKPGKAITGVVAILAIGIILGGLIMRLLKHPLRLGHWFVLRRGLPRKAQALQWHSVIGTWFSITLLFSALTGLWWSYEGYQQSIHTLAGVEFKAKTKPDTLWLDNEEFMAQVTLGWQQLQSVAPEANKVRFSVAKEGLQMTYWLPTARHVREENSLLMAADGQVVKHQRFTDKSENEQLLKSWKMLHTGQYWGWIGQLVLCLSALAMAYMYYLGFRLFTRNMRASH